ncbi:TA system VapC family ribonuclease toxin [Luteolibacter sp. LG18]|uniref:TA system VapC family ribonuclease toxin n=1 Tax=Luteolibacter sp. LG18 TaxID=2819286 RepID=UPI002B2DCFCB|nr:ribonuclease VapC41 [Luteolibacter sp. LG18]
MDLLDVNVWLALCDENHQHHEAARHYWETGGAEELLFCRVTVLGLLRLATNSKAMAGQPFSVEEAWEAYQSFLALPEVRFLPDTGIEDGQMESWVQQGIVTPPLWTDAYLAALAMEAGCRLVSFDSDFKRFPGLRFLHLKGERPPI